jgi:hypothetical protein
MQNTTGTGKHPIREAVLRGVREAIVEFIAPTIKLVKLVGSWILRRARC